MPLELAFDHVGIAVTDLAAAAPLFLDTLDGTLLCGGDFRPLNQRSLQIQVGASFKVELLQPVGPGPLARFIDERGPGFHHVTLLVPDLAAMIDRLEGGGVSTVGTDLSNPRWQQAFIHPGDACGCLFQMVASTLRWDQPVDGIDLDEVLRGEWEWGDDYLTHHVGPVDRP